MRWPVPDGQGRWPVRGSRFRRQLAACTPSPGFAAPAAESGTCVTVHVIGVLFITIVRYVRATSSCAAGAQVAYHIASTYGTSTVQVSLNLHDLQAVCNINATHADDDSALPQYTVSSSALN